MAVDTTGRGFLLMGDLGGMGQTADGDPIWSAFGKTFVVGKDGKSTPYNDYYANKTKSAATPTTPTKDPNTDAPPVKYNLDEPFIVKRWDEIVNSMQFREGGLVRGVGKAQRGHGRGRMR